MARVRVGLLSSIVIGLACAATTWAAVLSWRGFTSSSSFLVPLGVIGLVVAVVGAVARWQRMPRVLVMVMQAVAGLVITNVAVTDTILPGDELGAAVRASLDAANAYASPVPEVGGISVHPLILAGGLIAFLLVDALGATFRRVPAAGLPLLAIYSVPVSLLDDGLSWQVFALTALGFLLMLYVQEQLQADRWGRALDDPSIEASSSTSSKALGSRGAAVRLSALTIAFSTVAVAVAVPPLVPTLSLQVFNFGNGEGTDDQINISNPMVDLRRDLRRGPDFDLVRITTDDPSPEYLRISVLNRFTDNEWSSGDRKVPSDQVADGTLPALQGVPSTLARTEYDYDVDVDVRFDSTWLPTQSPIASIDAPGDWRYDSDTMDFIASEDLLTTSGLQYSMTAVDLDLDPERLKKARNGAGDVPSELLSLPSSLAPSVRDLAKTVTENVPSRFEKAVALQQWFRDDGGFTYSLRRSEEGNGVDSLEAFLDPEKGRVGYCEQFAASMAVMARALGIPSRVAVGFLKPQANGDGTFVYSAHDLHAWPELYFADAGWVRFDPTPADRVRTVPEYTEQDVDVNPGQQRPQQPSQTATSGAQGAQQVPSSKPSEQVETGAAAQDSSRSDSGFPWVRLLLWLLVIALLMALLLVPRARRERQRARRVLQGPEAAWEEVRATMVDLRHVWPENRTPRESQRYIERLFGQPDDESPELRPRRGAERSPEAAEALGRIVLALELGRYARGHSAEPGEHVDDVATVVAALEAGVQPRVRTRSAWWPRSALRRRAAFEDTVVDDADELTRV